LHGHKPIIRSDKCALHLQNSHIGFLTARFDKDFDTWLISDSILSVLSLFISLFISSSYSKSDILLCVVDGETDSYIGLCIDMDDMIDVFDMTEEKLIMIYGIYNYTI
jgi:hypothetical protein